MDLSQPVKDLLQNLEDSETWRRATSTDLARLHGIANSHHDALNGLKQEIVQLDDRLTSERVSVEMRLSEAITQLRTDLGTLRGSVDPKEIDAKLNAVKSDLSGTMANMMAAANTRIDMECNEVEQNSNARHDALRSEVTRQRSEIEGYRAQVGELATTIDNLLKDWQRFKRVMTEAPRAG